MVPAAAGAGAAATGAAPTGAGVAATTAGCCGWASVGAGAAYGAGAAAGVSLSLAQPLTIKTSPARANTDVRSIDFSFRATGRLSKIASRSGGPHPTRPADFITANLATGATGLCAIVFEPLRDRNATH